MTERTNKILRVIIAPILAAAAFEWGSMLWSGWPFILGLLAFILVMGLVKKLSGGPVQ
jgi:asparagine N-glycosylation enzyme membrane subunit Stt3